MTQKLRALLLKVKDTGLIYWEPQTAVGAYNKSMMLKEINEALAEPEDDLYSELARRWHVTRHEAKTRALSILYEGQS